MFAVGREFAATDFPFISGQPFDLSRMKDSGDRLASLAEIEKSDVVVAICSIGRHENVAPIGKWSGINVVCGISLLPFVRSEKGTFTRGNVGDENIRVGALRLFLCVND